MKDNTLNSMNSLLELKKTLRDDLEDILDLIGKCNIAIFSFNQEVKIK